ncbi:MAG: hypothetical protein O3B08_18125 [Proteobacteria bacterium]|nr:hypothetical protein [Pseudomonadota bacterium]
MRIFPEGQNRKPRRTVTHRSQSGVYYGFTEFGIDDPLPNAAGIYMLVTEILGPDRWQIILVGETGNFAAGIAPVAAAPEALRRGATRVLLHFSLLGSRERLNAARDLWMANRAPLVSWTPEAIRQTA